MGKFDRVLLTVDFDRTLTGPDSAIPQRNLDAIEYFMENGGTFTVNTGRSTATFWQYLDTIPRNAPLLLYNGSAAYDKGRLELCVPMDLDPRQTMEAMARLFPDMNLEIQGAKIHYLVKTTPEMVALYDNLKWRYTQEPFGEDMGPFLKFSLFGAPREPMMSTFFEGSEADLRRFDQAEEIIRKCYPGKVEVFRAAPRIIDVHAKGVSKLTAARQLQKNLGKELLVCVGDAENDITMLDGADYAFCPADGVVAQRYPNVCSCGEGAVADVIYKKIPEILAIQP